MGNQQVEVKQAKFKTIVSEGSSLQGSQIASAVLTGMVIILMLKLRSKVWKH